jgi:hypothetical protein
MDHALAGHEDEVVGQNAIHRRGIVVLDRGLIPSIQLAHDLPVIAG